MADIDMIPRSYRAAQRTRRLLRHAGAALAVVLLLGGASVGTLRWRAAAIQRQAEALDAAATRAQADQARSALLQAGYQREMRDEGVLRALRRGGEFDALARALEGAANERAWLTELTLERDAQAAATADGAGHDAGGAEQLALPAEGATPAQTWRLSSTVHLKGQAADYAAITAFLSALERAPGMSGVRLLGSARAGDGAPIDFEAAGMLARSPTP